jgi:hypothetical protein
MAGESDRREAKRFEPPPWERDQFDALQEREAEVDQPEEPGSAPAAGAGEAETGPAETGPAEAQPAPVIESTPDAASEAKVGTMLIQLSAEEPKIGHHAKMVGVFSAGVLMFVGLCMLVWGGLLLLLGRGNIGASVIALTVLLMGGLFGGAGLVLGVRVTRGQGD